MDLKQLRSELVVAEGGFQAKAYKDSLGYWTAGLGHLLDQRQDWSNKVFDQPTMDDWYNADIATATSEAESLPEWASLDTDARQNAVVELVFNMGRDHWKLFIHCRMAIIKKQWQEAHDQLLDSVWASQVHATRANRLANYILTGEFNAG